MRIGDQAMLGDRDAGIPGRPIYLSPRLPDSVIAIGRATRMSNGVKMIALNRIEMGEGCLAGAGAVVARDVELGSVAGGNPARVISRWLTAAR